MDTGAVREPSEPMDSGTFIFTKRTFWEHPGLGKFGVLSQWFTYVNEDVLQLASPQVIANTRHSRMELASGLIHEGWEWLISQTGQPPYDGSNEITEERYNDLVEARQQMERDIMERYSK